METRKLASIQVIREIAPIKGADNIELATINNWKVVVAKDVGHIVGDYVVYCEIDSFLPVREEFEFLRKSSHKKMGDVEGFRLRTIKLRGQVSQGLIMPLDILLDSGYRVSAHLLNENIAFEKNQTAISLDEMIEITAGTDVTDVLGILKYEPPIPAEISGEVKGAFPSFIPKTDEERVQNLTDMYEEWKSNGILFQETEKLDGTSSTFYYNNGEFGICGRNWEFKENGNSFWKVANEHTLKERLIGLDWNLAIQGELIGEGIQGNPYKLKGQQVRIFKMWNIDTQTRLSAYDQSKTAKLLGLNEVPVIDKLFTLPDTIDELLEYVDGKSVLNSQTNREGSVFQSLDGKFSFKVISNRFLLKSKN